MNVKYFDAHCHVQFDAYDKDQAEIVEKMKAEGVAGIVVGCDGESSLKAVELAEKYEHLYAAVGLHPNRSSDEGFNLDDKVTESKGESYDEHLLRNLMMSRKVVAVGECGLDYYRPKEVTEEVKKRQKEVFTKHVHLAGSTGRPLIIHSRPSKGTQDAYQEVIEILKEAKQTYPDLVGDMHFFVGTPEIAKQFFDLGFTVSFTAVITFARDYDAVIRAAPLDRILSETDSPYVPPTNRARGSRNDPLAVQDVVAKIAEIRGENSQVIREALLGNAKRLFDI